MTNYVDIDTFVQQYESVEDEPATLDVAILKNFKEEIENDDE